MNNKIFTNKNNIIYRNYFNIPMIPYPSGSLHIGHIRNYSISDTLNRFLKINNRNIYNYIGWDCFGTPAETASILINVKPIKWIFKNISYMRCQLKLIGFFNKWDKFHLSCNKSFYQISQWIFIKLLKNKLIYLYKKKVNWDPLEKTILSNEQVIDGKGWRSKTKIKFLKKKSYFVNIKRYKNELLFELYNLNWPKKVKIMQINWLGRNKRICLKFIYMYLKKNIKIFIDNNNINLPNIILTNFFYNSLQYKKKINLIKFYKLIVKKIVNIGNYFYNTVNFKKIELWLLKLDIKFIKKYYTIKFNKNNFYINIYLNIRDKYFWTKLKFLNFYKFINFWKIEDWGISRQRYWGTPIPISRCNNCGFNSNILKQFLLPKYLSSLENYNILNKNIYFLRVICSICKNLCTKEYETIDTFFDSSWYFLNYLKFKKKNNIINKWFPIDFYCGGVEHAILHLLYSRFIIKFLRDIKYLIFGEPIKFLFTQGMILNKTYYYKNNGIIKWISKNKINSKNYYTGKVEKMSKSKKNGINPNNLIKNFGIDSLRLAVLNSSLINDFVWKKKYILHCYKFIKKIWLYYKKTKFNAKNKFFKLKTNITNKDKKIIYIFYKKFENINMLYSKIKYNKIIIDCFLLFNKMIKINFKFFVFNELFSSFIKIIYPIIPHLSFKLWNKLLYNLELGVLKKTNWYKIYKIKLNISKKYLLLLNNKKIDLLLIKNKLVLNKKIINYIFLKRNTKSNNIDKIVTNKNLINIIGKF